MPGVRGHDTPALGSVHHTGDSQRALWVAQGVAGKEVDCLGLGSQEGS